MNTYKLRLYPTQTQQLRLEESIDTCRKLYNYFVAESRLAYKEGYELKRNDLQRIIPELLGDKKDTTWNKPGVFQMWKNNCQDPGRQNPHVYLWTGNMPRPQRGAKHSQKGNRKPTCGMQESYACGDSPTTCRLYGKARTVIESGNRSH